MSYASACKQQELLNGLIARGLPLLEAEKPDALLAAIGYDHSGWVAAPRWYADEKHNEFLRSAAGREYTRRQKEEL